GRRQRLWAASPAADAHSRVAKLVSGLRAALPADVRDVIETVTPGYLLHVGDGYDVGTFESLVSNGRAQLAAADYTRAMASLDAALELWRGPAFGEFADDDFARVERARLEDARMTAIEDRAQALLYLGRHTEVIGQLEALVVTHPFRERLWEELMVALYRSGRQADALHAYQDVREKLRDELGVEPSESLRSLEGAILRQEEGLAAPPVDRPVSAPVASDPDLHNPVPLRSRRRLLLTGAGAVLAVSLFAATGVLVFGGDDDGTTSASGAVTVPY